jgi:hypothetical protein
VPTTTTKYAEWGARRKLVCPVAERDWAGYRKKFVRREVFRLAAEGVVHPGVAVMLPGHSALCVREMIKHRPLSKLRILAFERDADSNAKLQLSLAKLKPTHHKLSTSVVLGDITQFVDVYQHTPISFAFLDWCGPITKLKANWLEEIAGSIQPDALVAATFSRSGFTKYDQPFWDRVPKWFRVQVERDLEYGCGDDVHADDFYSCDQVFSPHTHKIATTWAWCAYLKSKRLPRMCQCSTYNDTAAMLTVSFRLPAED